MTNSHPVTVSAAALAAFAAAALVVPPALAVPAADAATAHVADTAMVCLTPEVNQRLADAVEQAKAEALLRKTELDSAQAKVDEQQRTVAGFESGREKILQELRTILTKARNSAKDAKVEADAKHQLAQTALTAAEKDLADLTVAVDRLKDQVAALKAQKAANEAGTDELSQAVKTEDSAVTAATAELAQKTEALRLASEELKTAQAGLETTQRELVDATTARDEAVSNLENARESLAQAQTALQEKKAKNDELKAQGGKAGIERKIQEAEAALQEATQAVQDHEQLITAAADKVTKAEQAKQKAEADLAPVKEAAKTRLENIKNFDKALAESQEAGAAAHHAATEAAGKVAALQMKMSAAEERINALEAEIEQLNTRKGGLDGEISALNADIRALMGQANPDQQQLEEKRTQLGQKQAEWERVTAEIATKTEEKDNKQNEYDEASQEKAVAQSEADRQNQIAAEADQRTDTLGQSLTAERERLNQEQPTLAGLQQEFDNAAQKHTEEVAAHEALVAQRAEKEKAQQEKQAALDSAKAVKTAYGTDFDGDIDAQYQQAEDNARQLAEQAAQTVTAREGDLAPKQEKVTTLTAGVETRTADRDAKALLKKAAEDAELAARNTLAEAQARLTTATEARAAGHAKTVADLTVAEQNLATEEAKLAPAAAVVAEKKATAAEAAKEKAQADGSFSQFEGLGADEGVERPLNAPALADLEKQLVEIRRGLAVSEAAQARLYTYQSLRNMMRDSFQAAQGDAERAEAELAQAQKLPRCTAPAPEAQAPKGQAPATQAPAAQAQKPAPAQQQAGAGALAKTGVSDLSGVALLTAMVGAGTLVTASRRRNAR